ncbi:MAG: HlyD family efflux transporter periplasmic adaptor subunit [Gammaproteobacteria bacterium]|nr:HlyD family efflux transporter periplasmic adaptor subunit [Gammaproteobacteria bacterium]
MTNKWLVFAGLLLMGCEKPLSEVPALGTLERDRIELVADSNEPIRAVLLQEGDTVEIGDAIVIQDTERADAALAGAIAEEAAAKAALAEAEEGPRVQEIQQGRARLEAAKSARQTARYELDRQISLVERNYSSQSLVDILQGRYEESLARETEATAALDELLEGTRFETIDQVRHRFAAASATVRNLQITKRRATLRSPVAGVVEALPFEVGERPPIGSTAAVVLASAPTYARVHISEPVRTRVNSGTRAEVHIDGYAQAFPARVRWVAADAAFTPYFALSQHDRSRLSYVAEIDLIGDDVGRLPVGVPVQVTFPGLDL